jgi:dihydrolipoamide dehydrogenase
MPTKTYLNSVKIYDHALHGAAYGVTAENVQFDHAAVLARKDKVVKMLVSGVESKMKAHKVTIVKKTAVITGKNDGGFIVTADDEVYCGKNLIIAAGSEAIVPPIKGLAFELTTCYALTSREVLDIKEIPQRLTVIGGGVIGLEMAAYFAAAGSKVTVIEMLDKIAGYTDGEISAFLLKELQKKGIEFKLGCRVTEVGQGFVAHEKDGKTETVDTDKVLVSIGRKPSTAGLGLESLGVCVERGAVVTDKHMRTNVSGVYAVGDVNGKSMLAHTAYREAEVAVNHILGRRDHMRYDAIPAVIYTSPEAAGVGETEESALEKGLDVTIKKLSMRYSGRFVAENDGGDGLCKVLVENGTERVVGVHLIGGYASEIIYGAAFMVESRWRVNDLKELVFPHPTVAEIVRETLFS